MEAARPKLKIPLTPVDKAVEFLCWAGLAFIWGWAVLAYFSLPETVPVHFSPSGQPDGYGSRASMLFVPVIPTVLAIGLTFLNRFPHTFNYLEEITPANAARNYQLGTRLLRWVKLFQVIVFGAIALLITNSASEQLSATEITRFVNLTIAGVLLMPVVLLLIVFLQYRKTNSAHA